MLHSDNFGYIGLPLVAPFRGASGIIKLLFSYHPNRADFMFGHLTSALVTQG